MRYHDRINMYLRMNPQLAQSTMSRPEGGTHVAVGPSAVPEARLHSSPCGPTEESGRMFYWETGAMRRGEA